MFQGSVRSTFSGVNRPRTWTAFVFAGRQDQSGIPTYYDNGHSLGVIRPLYNTKADHGIAKLGLLNYRSHQDVPVNVGRFQAV